MNINSSLKWLESNGGPFLLLEEHLLEKWQGVFVKNSSVLESDYDRACGVYDYIGLISVDSGFGIILGDEPFPTTWLPLSKKLFENSKRLQSTKHQTNHCNLNHRFAGLWIAFVIF